jgi:hypothetical protein
VDTYEAVHAGDYVLGHDGAVWGVAEIDHSPALRVVLVRDWHRVEGRPPAGTPVTILHREDVSAEFAAVEVLAAGGLDVELIGERWTA